VARNALKIYNKIMAESYMFLKIAICQFTTLVKSFMTKGSIHANENIFPRMTTAKFLSEQYFGIA
jgi:hypothetical protein